MDDCNYCNECDSCKGPRGPRGFRGPRGYEGPTGYDGKQGIPGPKGDQGKRGPQGATGDKGDKGEQGPIGMKGEKGEQGPRGERGPKGTFSSSFGYAYNQTGSSKSGIVKFSDAGPLCDVQVTNKGLKVANHGIYQIDYKVVLVSKAGPHKPSNFQIKINDLYDFPNSITESLTSTTMSSTQLVKLNEGDIVMLVANLQAHAHYKLATLQVLQIG